MASSYRHAQDYCESFYNAKANLAIAKIDADKTKALFFAAKRIKRVLRTAAMEPLPWTLAAMMLARLCLPRLLQFLIPTAAFARQARCTFMFHVTRILVPAPSFSFHSGELVTESMSPQAWSLSRLGKAKRLQLWRLQKLCR